MGVITLVCVVVTGFLVAMQWYASRIDLDDMRAKAQESATKQAAKSIIEELKKQQPKATPRK